MSRPVAAIIDSDALKNNLNVVRRFAPKSKVWSVIKANAYGHGFDRVWPYLNTTDGFALLNIEEAIKLRNSGWQGPILMLEGFFDADELYLFDQYRLTTSVHSQWQIDALINTRLNAPIDIYLKINSGMNRLGFLPEKSLSVWQTLNVLPSVGEVTLMTHFADAESIDGICEPLANIEQSLANIKSPRSFGNSAVTLWHPEAHFDWIRPGIILYGASPSGEWQDVASIGIRPVMSLQSKIIAIQHLRAGDTVGYGKRYRASGAQRIGIVACGYADGYPRTAPDGTPVWVDGVMTTTVGKVSMDMTAVDLTPCPHADMGSLVELWGTHIKIDDVAKAAGTIGYELMCALTPRVPVTVK